PDGADPCRAQARGRPRGGGPPARDRRLRVGRRSAPRAHQGRGRGPDRASGSARRLCRADRRVTLRSVGGPNVTAPQPQPGILGITPYKGGEGAVPGVADVRKLSSNESPLGPSPKAAAAYAALATELHRYPDGASDALRQAIAKH